MLIYTTFLDAYYYMVEYLPIVLSVDKQANVTKLYFQHNYLKHQEQILKCDLSHSV